MKRKFTVTVFVLAIAVLFVSMQSVITAQVQNRDQAALKAAMDKDTLEGDLKGAIEQYKRVAQSKDRSIAARAIVRMAECYQKLGDAEARKLYERVVREFADQKEPAALARARLSSTNSATASTSDHAVWSG